MTSDIIDTFNLSTRAKTVLKGEFPNATAPSEDEFRAAFRRHCGWGLNSVIRIPGCGKLTATEIYEWAWAGEEKPTVLRERLAASGLGTRASNVIHNSGLFPDDATAREVAEKIADGGYMSFLSSNGIKRQHELGRLTLEEIDAWACRLIGSKAPASSRPDFQSMRLGATERYDRAVAKAARILENRLIKIDELERKAGQ